jgi:hypothetical protein
MNASFDNRRRWLLGSVIFAAVCALLFAILWKGSRAPEKTDTRASSASGITELEENSSLGMRGRLEPSPDPIAEEVRKYFAENISRARYLALVRIPDLKRERQERAPHPFSPGCAPWRRWRAPMRRGWS